MRNKIAYIKDSQLKLEYLSDYLKHDKLCFSIVKETAHYFWPKINL